MKNEQRTNVKREILDFIHEYSGLDNNLAKVKKFIDERGENDYAVKNWLVQFEDCESVADFLIRYDLKEEPPKRPDTYRKVVSVYLKERSESSFFLRTSEIICSLYTSKKMPTLRLFTNHIVLVFTNGSRRPCDAYDPGNDLMEVTLTYEDDTFENPYPYGHVDLKDLHDRMME